jgi:sigma-E factor negative regulatory protein RseA
MVMDKISAYMDGETSRLEARQALLNLKQNEDCCELWKTFHLIGDVMRGEPVLDDEFTQRLRNRMKEEPVVLAPHPILRISPQYALSAAASLVAVAIIVALVFSDNPLKPQPSIAVAPKVDPVKVARSPSATQPRPAPAANQGKVNEYLMAHQEFSPSTALQGVAPYVRTVSAAHEGSDQ